MRNIGLIDEVFCRFCQEKDVYKTRVVPWRRPQKAYIPIVIVLSSTDMYLKEYLLKLKSLISQTGNARISIFFIVCLPAKINHYIPVVLNHCKRIRIKRQSMFYRGGMAGVNTIVVLKKTLGALETSSWSFGSKAALQRFAYYIQWEIKPCKQARKRSF